MATQKQENQVEMLILRKLADKSDEALAAHPADHPDKYPSLGLDIVDGRGRTADPPKLTRVSTGVIDALRAAGDIEVVGENVVHRPGGPTDDLWRVTHTFKHYDEIVFKTHDGRPDVRYGVVHQPDKYVDSDSDSDEVTDEHYANGQTRVDWFYDLELLEA